MGFKETGVVLIGAGGAARAWLEAYARVSEARIIGVYDHDPAWAERLVDETPGLLMFESLDDVLGSSDVLAAEINLPAEETPGVAARCLESGIAVGMRSTAATSSAGVEAILEKRRRRQPVRVFSPAFYYPPVAQAREALAGAMLGDLQTLRIKSVAGRHGSSEKSLITYEMPDALDLCGPEYEALPLMYLLGEVLSVHAFRRKNATVVTWVSSDAPGGARYGVYEAVRSAHLIVRSKLEPVEETFEAAGTDGYIFGAGLTGQTREQPALAHYVRDTYSEPLMKSDDDPLASYYLAAADLASAVKGRAPAQFGVEWVRELALLRDAIRASIERQQEVRIEGE